MLFLKLCKKLLLCVLCALLHFWVDYTPVIFVAPQAKAVLWKQRHQKCLGLEHSSNNSSFWIWNKMVLFHGVCFAVVSSKTWNSIESTPWQFLLDALLMVNIFFRPLAAIKKLNWFEPESSFSQPWIRCHLSCSSYIGWERSTFHKRMFVLHFTLFSFIDKCVLPLVTITSCLPVPHHLLLLKLISLKNERWDRTDVCRPLLCLQPEIRLFRSDAMGLPIGFHAKMVRFEWFHLFLLKKKHDAWMVYFSLLYKSTKANICEISLKLAFQFFSIPFLPKTREEGIEWFEFSFAMRDCWDERPDTLMAPQFPFFRFGDRKNYEAEVRISRSLLPQLLSGKLSTKKPLSWMIRRQHEKTTTHACVQGGWSFTLTWNNTSKRDTGSLHPENVMARKEWIQTYPDESVQKCECRYVRVCSMLCVRVVLIAAGCALACTRLWIPKRS